MEMSEIYNGSQWAHDIFLVNKAGVTEYVMGRPSTLITAHQFRDSHQNSQATHKAQPDSGIRDSGTNWDSGTKLFFSG